MGCCVSAKTILVVHHCQLSCLTPRVADQFLFMVKRDIMGFLFRVSYYQETALHLNPKIHLPSGWPAAAQQAVIHVIALAHYALVYSRSWAADSKLARVRLQAKVDKLECKIASLQE